MKKTYLSILLINLISCNKRDKCVKKYIDKVFLKELVVIKDTCKTFENYSSVKYYFKGGILMSGFGDRAFKQGNWKFFNKNEIVTEGFFKESEPIGTWKYESIGKIDWSTYIDESSGFGFSVPKNWSNLKEKNTVAFFNSTNLDNHNLKISVTVTNVNESLDVWVKKFLNYLEKENVNDLKSKKIDITGLKKSYEINYLRKYKGIGKFIISEFIFIFDSKVFIVSTSLKLGSVYDFTIINEQMLYSFKMYKKDGK